MRFSAVQRLGRGIGRLAWLFGRRDRRRALEHLALAFPERTGRDRRTLARAAFLHQGMNLAETLHLLTRDCADVERYVEVEGWQRVEALRGRYDDFAYFFVVGTSQATPHVSALAALLYRQGTTDPAAIKKAIESTAEDLGSPGFDNTFGNGFIRPAAALTGLGLNR